MKESSKHQEEISHLKHENGCLRSELILAGEGGQLAFRALAFSGSETSGQQFTDIHEGSSLLPVFLQFNKSTSLVCHSSIEAMSGASAGTLHKIL